MAELIVRDEEIKMLREALCAAQHAINQSVYNSSMKPHWSADIQKLINECDRHRPLGVDGKHGKRHTQTCGCEDKGALEHKHDWIWGRTFDMAISKKALYRRECRTCQTEETITEADFFEGLHELGWDK